MNRHSARSYRSDMHASAIKDTHAHTLCEKESLLDSFFHPKHQDYAAPPEEARVHTASLATPSMEYPSNCTHAMRLTCVRAVHRPELARATDHFPAGIRGG